MNEPISDLRKTIEGSLDRQKVWESIGKPISPAFMTEDDMNSHYRGRFSCTNKDVLLECQRTMKFVACPSCVKEKSYGEIAVTRFHISVIDDPMTTFKALGRCFCYNCAFEEFWPLDMDPRPQHAFSDMAEYAKQQEYRNMAMQGVLGGLGQAGNYGGPLARSQGVGVARGIGNPLGAATRDEYDALQNMYRQALMKHPKLAPPNPMKIGAHDPTRDPSILKRIQDALSGK